MPSIKSINYCPNCGSKKIANANFCMKCGYELKILEEILTKHDYLENSNEKSKELVDSSINQELENNPNANEISSDYIEQYNEATVHEEIQDDFEVIRPDTDDITVNDYNKTKEVLLNEKKAQNDDNNNFNLVRPNSQKVSVKKSKTKKNFSILNQKKY
ncbi:MAG: zinc ribbon domain-containing protein [Methanosphaera stadtmanae]|nr:zinc ribbon domain-containing protein [Methanosphaera stadtmanae]